MIGRAEFRLNAGLPWTDSIDFHIRHTMGQVPAYAQPVVFAQIEEGALSAPALTITNEEAQQLMDELWRVGLRPREGVGSAGSLAATQRHLDDMRKLAFTALKVKA